MEIPVFLEPTSNGFRASTQSPVTLSAEGGSESAAVAALNQALLSRLRSGGKIQMMAVQEAKTVLDICAEMRADPKHAEMEKAFEEYRKVANAVPDAD